MTQQPAAGRSTARTARTRCPIGVQGENRRLQSSPVTTRLADIAAQAGVSEATVSRVLNGKPGVAATTRQSVLAALDVLGYERPVRLRQRSEGLVGLITPELENPIFPALAQVIGQALTRQGYTPVLATQTPGGSTEDELTEMLVDRGVAGIIYVSGLHADTTADTQRYERLRAQGVPFVLVDGLAEDRPDTDVVVVVDGLVILHDPSADAYGHEGADDRADPAARELDLPVDARLVAGAVIVVEAARHIRAEDPVLDRQVPELQRLEDCVESHGHPLDERALARIASAAFSPII